MSHCFLKGPLQCHTNKEEKITFEQYSRIHLEGPKIVLYNVTQMKKKKITFEQYSRIRLEGPKIAICETASNVVFVLNSSFTSKDQYFRTALQEATDAFSNMLKDFGYTQKLELYDPLQHQTHPPSQHPLFQ